MTAPRRRKRKPQVTVAAFVDSGSAKLGLEIAAGANGLDRRIPEPAVNRPGLALTGFFQYFAHRRIQTLGHAEHAYLSSLSQPLQSERLRSMFEHRIPCVVVTRNRKPVPQLVKLGNEFGVPVFRCPMITGAFINVATILMENLQAPRTTMHGTMVEILGIGVLIKGRAGVGKSETALTLIQKGHRLVADDATALRLDSSGAVMASAMSATKYHMELRGIGIIHVPSLFGVASVRKEKKLDLVVSFEKDSGKSVDGLIDGSANTVDVLGVSIPHVTVPVTPGRDVAGLVEAAALDQTLKELGHDAAKELDEKLIKLMMQGGSGRE
jgi:HPr kinase/phosphorylase